MNLTALKYVVSLAREKHFGRAAEACEVSQPTLSVAVKKLEEELHVQLFERATTAVTVTPLGEEIVRQAQAVLERIGNITEIARRGSDSLVGPLKLGIHHTISPYLLPEVMSRLMAHAPQMPLVLEEDFTPGLIELLRAGEIDCAIVPEPFSDAALKTAPLYDEPFLVALPAAHPLATRDSVSCDALQQETVLMLGAGDCFRDQLVKTCPEFVRLAGSGSGLLRNLKGSSLDTIKHMVAAGMGVTVLPRLSIPTEALQPGPRRPEDAHIKYLPFAGQVPKRRVVLAWRRSYTREGAIETLLATIRACDLPGVTWLPREPGAH
jgi:LysR family hydrogen peroxide-inducible transcriptional activator